MKILFNILFVIFFAELVNGQEMIAYRESAEKLYVHTDKSFYLAGEIIWFKAYCVNANSGMPSPLSKIGYVEILDKTGKPIFQSKLALQHGSGNGSFLVPASIRSANYTLRAYTNWMKNFSSSFFFHKNITIVNASKKPDWQGEASKTSYDIQFFPESGELVDGIESRVGFRAVDQNGRGIQFQGVILNDKGEAITQFAPKHAGLGSFRITPRAGAAYKAQITTAGGEMISTLLPATGATGYVAECKKIDNAHLSLIVSTNLRNSNGQLFLQIAGGRGRQAVKPGELANGRCNFSIDIDGLPEGVSTFTVLNYNRQPVCERLYFKRPLLRPALRLAMPSTDFAQRAKVEVAISKPDSLLNPARADLSMSVFLVDSLQGLNEDEMAAYLLLTSALKGRVESPEYYLRNSGAAADEELDNLMLTHGWRKISGMATAQSSRASYLPEYEGQLIAGRVTARGSGQPAADKLTYLSAPGERYHLSNTVSDKEGNVVFVLDNNYGSTQIVVQTNSTTDSNYVVSITDPFLVKDSDIHPEPFMLKENLGAQMISHNIYNQVQNSFEGEKRLQFSYPLDMDSTAFYGVPDKKFFLDDYTRFPTMEEVFREFVADVYLRKRGEDFSMNVRNIPNSVVFRDPPLILIDGIPVFNVNKLIALDPLKIKKIEVVNKQLFQGYLANNGIVSCTSYGGDLAGYELDRNATILEFPGISFKREFFSPVYDSEERVQSPLADARSLLYWNPEIVLDKKNSQSLSFYTSDVPGNYAVLVEGIGSDGSMYSAVKRIVVR